MDVSVYTLLDPSDSKSLLDRALTSVQKGNKPFELVVLPVQNDLERKRQPNPDPIIWYDCRISHYHGDEDYVFLIVSFRSEITPSESNQPKEYARIEPHEGKLIATVVG